MLDHMAPIRLPGPSACRPNPALLVGILTTTLLLLALPRAGQARESPAAAAPERTSTGGPALEIRPHRFESRSGEVVEAELGTFRVPENRDDPASRALELSFVRFPSTTENPGPPIVYLAGGPGGSGVATAKGPRFPLFQALRQVADVIAFDQRGTGLSSSIPFCETPEPFPLDRPGTRAHSDAWLETTARHCARWWKEQGVDLAGYTTSESAHDLEDLRRALGVPKISLWAISYGTHLAFATLREHGDGIARMVLASAEGPDETVKLPARTQAFLARVSTRIGPLPAVGGEGGEGGEMLLSVLERVLKRLEAEPVTSSTVDPRTGAEVSVAIGALDVRLLVGYLIKNPATLAMLPGLVTQMGAGDFSTFARFALQGRSQLRGFRGMPEAMDATSGISDERRTRVVEQAPGTLLRDALNYPGPALAAPLGLKPLPKRFRAPLESDVPALFLSGTLDGRTYVESHRELAAGFSRAAHVVVENAGHDLFLASPEVLERMRAFLAGAAVSAEPIRLDDPFEAPSGGRE
ncbi:MAG: alpha/beta hydrolase [Holophagales bacterium]|nr:alpha/beta hydrolase [Holophagales bacterium]